MQDLNEALMNYDEDTLKGKYLTFWIGKELYGIEIGYVTEIVGIQAITVMPNMPEYIKGIINLRGIIVPLMDIRLRFSMEPKEYDDRTCVVVVDFAGTSIGLIVDSVSEVIDLPAASIVELPNNSLGLSNRYIKNIGKLGNDVALLVDCEKLLTADEFQAVSDVIQ
jgi:purine-binding chemotaxis protein CheW